MNDDMSTHSSEPVTARPQPIDLPTHRGASLAWIAWALLVLAVAAVLVYAAVPLWLEHRPTTRPLARIGTELGPLFEKVHVRLLEALTIVWFFFLGGSFGSFLNVVVYRVPRHQTLWGSSRCPSCGHVIRLHHNIPVLSWFFLSGRCYDCRATISSRYPIVEATVGSFFVALALAEWASGGATLPWRPLNIYRGIAWAVFDPQWDLILMFATHAALLWTLLAWALIWWDGYQPPAYFIVGAYIVAMLTTSLFPFVQPVPWWGGLVCDRTPGGGLLTTLMGAVLGVALGAVLFALRDGRPSAGTAPFLGLAGAVLGWQAVSSIALWTVALAALARALTVTRRTTGRALLVPSITPPSAALGLFSERTRCLWLWLGVLLHLVTWRAQTGWPVWPGPDAGVIPEVVGTVVAVVASSWITSRYVPPASELRAPSIDPSCSSVDRT